MLAAKFEGVDAQAFVEELRIYDAVVRTEVPLNANLQDGRCTFHVNYRGGTHLFSGAVFGRIAGTAAASR